MNGFIRVVLPLLLLSFLSGCYALYQDPHYRGPAPREPSLEIYYDKGSSYLSYQKELLREEVRYAVDRYTIETEHGTIVLDHFRRKEVSPSIVLVFPVLGGKENRIENYFAEYFVKHGLDAGIVHRDGEFKKPENFHRIEKLFRANIIRDRIALDFMEQELGKKDFATFGISRGAINVAMTAGVDERLKYNVLALGGSDIVSMFKRSDQRRLKNFRDYVKQVKGFTDDEFNTYLSKTVITDPVNLAHHMDARNTLLILSVFDRTVPFRNGLTLRDQLGGPETIFLLANHYTSLLYTQYVKLALPFEDLCLFPVDYIEKEALNFYRKSFGKGATLSLIPYRLLRVPFDLVGRIFHGARSDDKKWNGTRTIPGSEPFREPEGDLLPVRGVLLPVKAPLTQ